MKLFLQILISIVILIGIACLAVFCIACAKDMTFVEYVKSWFGKGSEATKAVSSIISTLSRLK